MRLTSNLEYVYCKLKSALAIAEHINRKAPVLLQCNVYFMNRELLTKPTTHMVNVSILSPVFLYTHSCIQILVIHSHVYIYCITVFILLMPTPTYTSGIGTMWCLNWLVKALIRGVKVWIKFSKRTYQSWIHYYDSNRIYVAILHFSHGILDRRRKTAL